MSTISEFVIFKVEREFYGIDIHHVENIEKILPITRIPYTKPYIKGVVNLRGNIIPIVDVRKRFAMEAKEFTEESRIIITNIGETKIGIIVDSSSEVLQLDISSVEDAPVIRGTNEQDFVRKVGKHEGRIIMLIDLMKVLGLEEADMLH